MNVQDFLMRFRQCFRWAAPKSLFVSSTRFLRATHLMSDDPTISSSLGHVIVQPRKLSTIESMRARIRESFKDICAGTVAGMTAKCIEMPFDTVKTRLQTSNLYKGPFDCFSKIVSSDGFGGLYRGLSAPLYGAMAENAIMFLAYGEAKRALSNPNEQLPLHYTAIAGMFSGLTVAFWLTPVELVKCRMQAAHTASAYSGVLDCARQTWRSEGLRGFYRGHVGTLLREGPGNACYFTAYETFCRLLTPDGQSRNDLSPGRLMLAGGLGGIAYWSSFFPADVVKSRMQTDMGAAHERASFLQTFRSIYSSEGLRGLYRGLGITLVRAVPANACIFYVYESALRTLNSMTADSK